MGIETKNIVKNFGQQKVLDDVSISLKKGELTGFLGPNGAGKSTLMKIITGYILPDSGEVWINNTLVNPGNISIKKEIGYLPEHNPLYADLYVREYLEITAGFYRMKNIKAKVSEIVEITGLGDEKHKKIGSLSKGYKQRVGLAQALIHNPSVLILDEPTTGLDPNQLEEIRGLIRQISREKTVLLSSHIMQEVEAVCDRVIIINKGKIVADGQINDVKLGKFRNIQIVCVEFNGSVSAEKLTLIPGVEDVSEKDNQWEITAMSNKDIRPEVFRFAVENNLTLLTLYEKQQNLEHVFHELTQIKS